MTALADLQTELEAIAAEIRTVAPDGWTVYAGPPSTEVMNSIIVGPRSPYLRRLTFSLIEAQYQLTVIVPLAAGSTAMATFNTLLGLLLPALDTLHEVRWESVDQMTQATTRAGADVIVCTILISA